MASVQSDRLLLDMLYCIISCHSISYHIIYAAAGYHQDERGFSLSVKETSPQFLCITLSSLLTQNHPCEPPTPPPKLPSRASLPPNTKLDLTRERCCSTKKALGVSCQCFDPAHGGGIVVMLLLAVVARSSSSNSSSSSSSSSGSVAVAVAMAEAVAMLVKGRLEDTSNAWIRIEGNFAQK